MTTVYYVVNPATPHGRAVIGFARSFLNFAYEVFKPYRLVDMKYVVFTDEDGARNPEKYTRDVKALKLIDDLKRYSGVCEYSPSGLFDTYEWSVVLCLRLYTPMDRVASVRVSAHEFIHFMTVPLESLLIDGFVRSLSTDIPEFRDVVEVVTACYDRTRELEEAGEEVRKRLAELVPELRKFEDICVGNYNTFRQATRNFLVQFIAEYIALNYFVLLQRFPVLSIRSILAMPYVFKYYVEHLATLFMEAVSTLAVNSAHAYHRLAHPEKPAEETVAFTMSVEGKVGGLRKKLQYGDHPKLRGFIHDVFLSTLRSPTVFPADVAPKYPEIYYEVMHLAREVAPVPIK
jgi:hypothetical protein